jgi:hypothetical protein
MNFTVICAVCMPVDLILENAPNEVILAQSSSHTWWRDDADAADDGSNPVASLLELFDGASLIVGYNCLSFDFPLVRRFYRRSDTSRTPEDRYLSHRSKTFDIMTRVKDVSGNYYKLEALLELNGIQRKTGDGMRAIQLWTDNKRDELEKYCHNDVVVTARLALSPRIKINEVSCVSAPCVGLSHQLRAATTHAQPADDFVMV